MQSFEDYIRASVVSRETIDTFLDPSHPCWAQFDPVVGYTLDHSMPRDGIDGSATISTAQTAGMRTQHNYARRPCRINTYGNSFTQCHQVSDGETWQEYLAAHLGEPIRNFGMGGFGVYQAYRRLIQIEQFADGAEYVVLYIWGDDHFRSLMRCRHAVIYPWWNHQQGNMFHGNFWANVEIDLDSGRLVEKENALCTPESLYRMTEPDFLVDALHDDLILQLYAIDQVEPESVDVTGLHSLADTLGQDRIDLSSREKMVRTVSDLKHAYGFKATKWILTQASEFCSRLNKRLLISLLCPTVTRQLLRDEPRYDQAIADFLAEEGMHVFDMNLVHQRDYTDFALSIEDYMKRYFIGHYSPAGNHFFAFSIKDKIVEWLDPKPTTYSSAAAGIVDFEGYLPAT